MDFTYNHHNISNARQLRKNMTPQERKLWYLFLRSYPVKFKRQCPIGNYIVDFYCDKAKLIVEIDGSQHYTPEGHTKDLERSIYLERMYNKIIRFTNTQIDKEFYSVCTTIDNVVKSRI